MWATLGLKVLGFAADFAIPAAIIWLVLFVARSLLTLALGIAGGLLDFVFVLNATVNPAQLTIVQNGWTILRDLANGMFILILLWIAITIIFNIENLGGKRLLVRLIIVAFFINFSLVMVSTVFAFGNELAKPFAKAMKVFPVCTSTTASDGTQTQSCKPPETTLSTLIIQNTRIQTVLDVIVDQGALQSARDELKKLKNNTLAAQKTGSNSIMGEGPALQAAAWTGFALLDSTTFAAGITSIPGISDYLKSVTNMAIGDGLLLITTIGVLTAAVVLFLRLFAMVLLGVSAPIAFLGIAFPKYGERFWSYWTDQLIRWTFTAPIFYFLLYLSLHMLQTNQSGSEKFLKDQTITSSLFMILNLVLFLIFLWMSVSLTKKTAGHMAEVVLGVGRKAIGFGLGVGTGFAAAGAAKLALRGQKSIDKVSSSWIGRGPIGGMLARRTQAYIQQQKKRVAGRASQWEGTSEEFKKSQLAGAVSAEQVTAISLAAIKDKQMGAFRGQETRAVRLATKLGSQEEVLKAFPLESNPSNVPGTTTKQEAVNKTLSKVDDLSKIGIPANAGPDDTKILLQGILFNLKNLNQLQRVGRENTSVFNELSAYWRTNWDNGPAQDFEALTTAIKESIKKTGVAEGQAQPIAQRRVREMNNYFKTVLANLFYQEQEGGERRRQRRRRANESTGDDETEGGGGGTTTEIPPTGGATTPPPAGGTTSPTP